MGVTAVEVRVMPDSPNADLEKIKKEIALRLKKARNIKIVEKDIAFGLKSLNLLVAWPEEEETDEIENLLNEIEHVSSATIENIRRAFG